MTGRDLADRIDALLPQTQCTLCGYSGCLPYARAIAAGKAEINQCPPGGAAGVDKLAALLGREVKPLNPANGRERSRAAARIDEARCIGCTLCIQACPVDAIVGAAKLMHTVIAELCTGCELCLPPCPVDCIVMVPLPQSEAIWTQDKADAARARFEFRGLRLAREQGESAGRLARKARERLGDALPDVKRVVILAALERARVRKAGMAPGNTTELPRQVQTAAIDARRAAAKKP